MKCHDFRHSTNPFFLSDKLLLFLLAKTLVANVAVIVGVVAVAVVVVVVVGSCGSNAM